MHMEYAEVFDALDLLNFGQHLIGEFLELREIGSDDLDRIRALDAGKRLLDVVLNILREVEADARHFVFEFFLYFVGQLFLGEPRRPLVERLERHEQLDIRKGRGVGAIVGTPMLRNDGDHLRMPEQNLPHLARRLGAGIQRDGRRHLRPDPEIALLERRKKFLPSRAATRTLITRNISPPPIANLVLSSAQRSAGV